MNEQELHTNEAKENAATQMDKEFYLNADHFGRSLYRSLAANDIASGSSKQKSKWLE